MPTNFTRITMKSLSVRFKTDKRFHLMTLVKISQTIHLLLI